MRSDAELVRRALVGRRRAFAELVRRWTGRVLAICHALVRHREVAEELTQETFVRAFAGLGTLRDPARFGPWLRGIARRVSYDWIESQRRPMVLFSQLGDGWSPEDESATSRSRTSEGGSPSEALERAEETSRLLAELDELPEELRTVLMLYYYADTTYQEVADLLEVSVATVNARLAKGRALLRRRLESSGR